MRRIRSREEPPGPCPEDYLRKIKEWLEEERTQARQALEVLDWYDLGYIWVSWPLPPEYRVHAGPPETAYGELSPDGPAAAEDETERDVILRVGITDELKLWLDF